MNVTGYPQVSGINGMSNTWVKWLNSKLQKGYSPGNTTLATTKKPVSLFTCFFHYWFTLLRNLWKTTNYDNKFYFQPWMNVFVFFPLFPFFWFHILIDNVIVRDHILGLLFFLHCSFCSKFKIYTKHFLHDLYSTKALNNLNRKQCTYSQALVSLYSTHVKQLWSGQLWIYFNQNLMYSKELL